MDTWVSDLRFAFRVLTQRPGPTVVILLALALGIGGNTAIFSIINGLFLNPLPFPEPERVVQAERSFPQGRVPNVSPSQFFYWHEHSKSFAALAGWENQGAGFNLSGAGRPERLAGSRVTADFFKVFGMPLALGREFAPSDDVPGAQPVTILSHELWNKRFGADGTVLGKTLILDKVPYVVVGVAARGFRIPETAQLWVPARLDPTEESEGNIFYVTGRLKPRSSLKESQSEIRVVGGQFLATLTSPERDAPEQVTLRPFQEFLFGNLRPVLLVLLAAVGFVLLIACANVANLQLARAASRKEEIFIRTALGASSGKIVRQLLIESVVLSLTGGILGLILCAVALRPLLVLSPMAIPRVANVALDGRVLLFTLGVSLLTGVLFGSLPSIHASRQDFSGVHRSNSSRNTGEVRAGRARTLLVGTQIALAVVLTLGAVLLLRSFFSLRNADVGFQADGLLTTKMSLGEQYAKPEALELLGRRLLPEISSIPGVTHAALVNSLPLELGANMPFTIVGRDTADRSSIGQARYIAISGEYFSTLGLPLKRGRLLTDNDRQGSELVVLINEAAGLHYWPGENPLGKQIHLGLPHVPALADPSPRQIVGIVGDVRERSLERAPDPVIYVPMGQIPPNLAAVLVKSLPVNLVVKSSLPPSNLLSEIQDKVWSLDPEQPVSEPATMKELLARSLGRKEFNMLLLSILAGTALILASIGIYGMVAYWVNQRTREVGIRVALGASRGQVVQLMADKLIRVLVVGMIVGLVGSIVLARLLRGMGSVDWTSFLMVSALFMIVTLLAAALPIRRAIRVRPVEALKM